MDPVLTAACALTCSKDIFQHPLPSYDSAVTFSDPLSVIKAFRQWEIASKSEGAGRAAGRLGLNLNALHELRELRMQLYDTLLSNGIISLPTRSTLAKTKSPPALSSEIYKSNEREKKGKFGPSGGNLNNLVVGKSTLSLDSHVVMGSTTASIGAMNTDHHKAKFKFSLNSSNTYVRNVSVGMLECNRYGHDPAIVSAAICAGLYPNLSLASGMPLKIHRSHKNKNKPVPPVYPLGSSATINFSETRQHTYVHPHPASAVTLHKLKLKRSGGSGVMVPQSEVVCYHSKESSYRRLMLRTISISPNIAVALFAKEISLYPSQRLLVVDNWLEFGCCPHTAMLILNLRKILQKWLQYKLLCFNNHEPVGGSFNEKSANDFQTLLLGLFS